MLALQICPHRRDFEMVMWAKNVHSILTARLTHNLLQIRKAAITTLALVAQKMSPLIVLPLTEKAVKICCSDGDEDVRMLALQICPMKVITSWTYCDVTETF
eukprot:gnl/TRDRNA2_/TRDRNA2_155994_c3_seq1.p1 gnl/TRDRNA2_/TRDRNA2_155994_c3~~gnl/TRDRNA2_/TRDRNA2_155994_c3_seq1.p1  ORF type:complete len:102 (+),score=13.72 gnl/TRDRNA2_/TRDRNA2_155994_c3_seq1:1-306(+)